MYVYAVHCYSSEGKQVRFVTERPIVDEMKWLPVEWGILDKQGDDNRITRLECMALQNNYPGLELDRREGGSEHFRLT